MKFAVRQRGAEWEVRRTRRSMLRRRAMGAAIRAAADVVEIPRKLAVVLTSPFAILSAMLCDLSDVVFASELDAARQYYALTGFDTAQANGDPDRYRQVRIAAGDETWPDEEEDDEE